MIGTLARKSSNKFGISLAYSYLWLSPKVLPLGKNQTSLFFRSLIRTFASMKRMILIFCVCCVALCSNGQTYQQCVRKAIDCLAADSVELAKAQFKQALRLSPASKSNAIVYRYLGRIYEREGEHQLALDSYGKGLHVMPADTALLMSRAGLYLMLGNEEKAVTDYTSVLEQDAEHIDALFFRAYAYAGQRKNPLARQDYERILRLDPMHENAHLGLVLLNNKERRPREAMEGINRLIEHYPRHSHLYLVRAGMEEERKQYEPARHDYDQAVLLAPQDAEVYLARATFRLKLNERKEAMADLKQALKYGANPDEVATLMHQATTK